MKTKPKKKRARKPKKPPPDPIPTPSALSDRLMDLTVLADGILRQKCHAEDIGKPIGAVLFKRLAGGSRPES